MVSENSDLLSAVTNGLNNFSSEMKKKINDGDVEMAFQYFKGKAILDESTNTASVISVEPLIIAEFEDCFK